MNSKWQWAFLLIPVFTFTGCYHAFGPEALRRTYPGYSQALTQMWNEQLLFNLVRMRYGELPCFLDVTNIAAEQSLAGKLGWAAEVDTVSNKTTNKPEISITHTETPKFTYLPIQGQEFIKRFLTPIPPTIVLALTQNGWKMDRIFNLCIERINNLNNAPTASGPTPASPPEYKKFAHLTSLLRELQENDLILFGKQPKDFPDTVVQFVDNKELSSKIKEVKELLNVATDLSLFKIADNFLDMKEDNLTIRFRSLLGIMFFLSQAVEVPPVHKKAQIAPFTQRASCKDFNWDKIIGNYLKIHCQPERPLDAYLAVQYRKHWYFVADNDHSSKATLVLLYTLFNLQTSKLKPKEPVLTLSL